MVFATIGSWAIENNIGILKLDVKQFIDGLAIYSNKYLRNGCGKEINIRNKTYPNATRVITKL